MTRASIAIVVTVALTCVAARAAAYSDPRLFASPVWEGGAGGRWFTGSASDGYTCAVCHSGGVPAPVRIHGLPLDGYVPGARYEVVVDWPDAAAHVGVTVELSDGDGHAAGAVVLPEANQLDDAELCVPPGAGIGAASLTTTPAVRSVIAVADCGARQLRFLWTAPSDPTGTSVRFSGALVAGNASANPEHDGVTAFSRVLRPVGVAAPTEAHHACAVMDGAPFTSTAWIAMLIGLLLYRRRSALDWLSCSRSHRPSCRGRRARPRGTHPRALLRPGARGRHHPSCRAAPTVHADTAPPSRSHARAARGQAHTHNVGVQSTS